MTKLTNCYSCIKYLVFAFNFLFWLLGCTVLAVGIWIKVDPNSIQQQYKNEAFQHFLNDSATFGYQSTSAYILIAVGAVIMFVGFLGCCGAIRESQCMLALFFLALTLIFAVLMASGVYAILSRNDMESYIRLALVKAVNSYHNETKAAKLMDFVQSTFKCCGATESGGQDYGGLIPPSCGNNMRPCPAIIYHELTPNLVVIAGVTIGIAIVLVNIIYFWAVYFSTPLHSTEHVLSGGAENDGDAVLYNALLYHSFHDDVMTTNEAETLPCKYQLPAITREQSERCSRLL